MKDTKELTKLADELATLSVAELQEFKKILKDKYGLEEAKPVVIESAKVEEVKEEQKTSFNIVLTKVSEVTSEKLNVVKLINKLTNLGLQPSMALTKELPAVIMENVPASEAEEFKAAVLALNAEVELK